MNDVLYARLKSSQSHHLAVRCAREERYAMRRDERTIDEGRIRRMMEFAFT